MKDIDQKYDVVIVGGGTAGVAAAYELQKEKERGEESVMKQMQCEITKEGIEFHSNFSPNFPEQALAAKKITGTIIVGSIITRPHEIVKKYI